MVVRYEIRSSIAEPVVEMCMSVCCDYVAMAQGRLMAVVFGTGYNNDNERWYTRFSKR